MSDQDFEVEEKELTALKAKADLMGVKYHTSIGAAKLQEKIQEHAERVAAEVDLQTPAGVGIKKTAGAATKKKEAGALTRVVITCMNPMKKEWEGEIFSAGNSVVGTYKKYVPFGVEWHVPKIILNMIEGRKCQTFQTRTDSKGNKSRVGKLITEFAVQVLPALTEDELKDLAQRQAMANGTADAA